MPVVTLDITHRSPFLEGRPFGPVGSYELLEGMAHFVVDPLHPSNAAIIFRAVVLAGSGVL